MRKLIAQIDRQAWVRFFAGIGGLLVAFICALLSTALRESGYPIFAAAVASFALLAAGAVGLYTVPYLAKRVARERWIDALEYEITKEGVIYLAAVLVISVAALNTGNNLLFIVISAMLSAILISGIASAFVLRRVAVSLSLPKVVFAEERIITRLRLTNKRSLPLISLQVSTAELEKGKLRWKPTVFRLRGFRNGKTMELKDWKLQREHSQKRVETPDITAVYFPVVAAGSSAHADVELKFPRRGVYQSRALAVSTRFPFSFVKKTRKVSIEGEVIVLPRIQPVEQIIPELAALSGSFESLLRGQGHDLYRIRDHVAGDSARSLDWKATARSGSLMVREFTKDDERRVCIVFDNPAESALAAIEYERMVSECASAAWHLRQAGLSLEYIAPDFDSTDTMEFLHYLAVVTPFPADEARHVPELPYDAFTLVFTASDWANAAATGAVIRYRRAAV